MLAVGGCYTPKRARQIVHRGKCRLRLGLLTLHLQWNRSLRFVGFKLQ